MTKTSRILVKLSSLRPGTTFVRCDGSIAELLYVNHCRARIRLEPKLRQVPVKNEFGEITGEREFYSGVELDICPDADVELLPNQERGATAQKTQRA